MQLHFSKRVVLLSLVVFAFVVGACTAVLPDPQPTQSILPTQDASAIEGAATPPFVQDSPVATPAAAVVAIDEAPKPGKAGVRGVLVTDKGLGPIPGTQFYLKRIDPEARAEGPWTLILVGPETEKGDVVGQSGPRGEFFMNDVPPGKYYLIVWAPLNWIPIETEGEVKQPREFELKAGEIADLGSLMLSWP